jgi:hypothetical protein
MVVHDEVRAIVAMMSRWTEGRLLTTLRTSGFEPDLSDHFARRSNHPGP